MTLAEIAERFERADIAPAEHALASLKRCRPARPPVYRTGDLYSLDPHDDDLDLWVFRLGLRPPRVRAKPTLKIAPHLRHVRCVVETQEGAPGVRREPCLDSVQDRQPLAVLHLQPSLDQPLTPASAKRLSLPYEAMSWIEKPSTDHFSASVVTSTRA